MLLHRIIRFKDKKKKERKFFVVNALKLIYLPAVAAYRWLKEHLGEVQPHLADGRVT